MNVTKCSTYVHTTYTQKAQHTHTHTQMELQLLTVLLLVFCSICVVCQMGFADDVELILATVPKSGANERTS